jgi:thioredoxin reductase
MSIHDAIIIGGGPGGLGMAASLVRQAYTTLVFDSGVYRNAATKYIHATPALDYVEPHVFRSQSRETMTKHYQEIQFCDARVKRVAKVDGVFEVEDDAGTVHRSRKLGLATGVRDLIEKEIEGYADCWGRGIFHCLFCHGYEEKGSDSVGVLVGGLVSNDQVISHVALMATRLAKSVTVYTNGRPEMAEALKTTSNNSPRLRYEHRRIARFALRDQGPAVDVVLEDGTVLTEGFVASHPDVEQAAPFAEQLGLELGPSGEIKVSAPWNETSVKGCFAAGDAATPMRNVMQAINMGGFAGAGMTTQLQHELL